MRASQTLYDAQCSGCHGGSDGTLGRAPNLFDAKWLATVADQDIEEIVRNGIPDTEMSGFAAGQLNGRHAPRRQERRIRYRPHCILARGRWSLSSRRSPSTSIELARTQSEPNRRAILHRPLYERRRNRIRRASPDRSFVARASRRAASTFVSTPGTRPRLDSSGKVL
jgi:hypothetical protein